MRSRRLLAMAACLAAVALAAGGCGGLQQSSAPITEPLATVEGPLEQTIYTAVDFVGRSGLLAGYRQTLGVAPPRATAAAEVPATAPAPVPGTSEIWRTTDGGRTWRGTPLGSWQVGTIDMVTAKVGYLTATDPDTGSAVLRTADGGRTWHEVLALAFDPSIVRVWSPSQALVLSQGTLWSTEDGGLRWHQVVPDVQGIAAASFVTQLRGYAVSGTRILQTQDGGVHWQAQYALPQALTLQLGAPTGATIDVLSSGRGWASLSLSACWPSGCPNVVLHTDVSGHWQIVSGEDAGPIAGIHASEDGLPGGAQALWATGPESAVWNGAGGLWQTEDGGATWQEVGAPKAQQPSPAFVAVSGVGTGDLWAVGQDQWGGYLLHRAAAGWQQVRPRPYPVAAVDFVTARVGYGIGLSWAPRAIVGTRNGGRTWHVLGQVSGSLPVAIDFTSAEEGYLATAGAGGTLWRTSDGGWTWQVIGTLDAPPISLAFRDPSHGTTLLETGPGWPLQFSLRQTSDGGATWLAGRLPEALTDTLSNTTPVVVTSAAAVFPGPTSGYFLALVGRQPQLWQTQGSSWQAVDVPVGSGGRGTGPEQYQGGAMSAAGPADVWLALQPLWPGANVRVLRLGASQWQAYDLPLGLRLDLPEGSETISVFGRQRAVLLTNLGPLETVDGGRTWRPI